MRIKRLFERGLVLIVTAALLSGSRALERHKEPLMKVESVVLLCGKSNAGAIVATHVRIAKDAEREMIKHALSFCRLGQHSNSNVIKFKITDKSYYGRTPTDGRVLQWGIQCVDVRLSSAESKENLEC